MYDLHAVTLRARAAMWGLAAVAAAAVLPGPGATPARAQFPERPVRIIIPFGPGGVADVTTRMVALKMSERLKQQFVVDNRPGAGGINAASGAVSAAADGYTLLLTGNGSAISETLIKTKPYSVIRDFTSVTALAQFDMLLAVKGDSQLSTIAKLIAHARANPGKLNAGTVAAGSTQHLSAELFKDVAGVEIAMVTFRSTPDLITAIIRGDIDIGFDFLAAFGPSLQDGKIKIIASGGERRTAQLPDVPTARESGLDYVVSSWNGLSTRTGTPPEVVDKLSREINAVLKDPEINARAAQLGMEIIGTTPEQMRARMLADIEKWRRVIDKLGIAK